MSTLPNSMTSSFLTVWSATPVVIVSGDEGVNWRGIVSVNREVWLDAGKFRPWAGAESVDPVGGDGLEGVSEDEFIAGAKLQWVLWARLYDELKGGLKIMML
jgi:hypothetical protein